MKLRNATGMTLIELLLVVAIIGIVAAIGIPGVLNARMASGEASAIGSLRAINSGEAAYSSSCAAGFYAVSLADLAKPPAGANQGFVSPDLGADGIIKSGYVVSLTRASGAFDSSAMACNTPTGAPATTYYASATPVTYKGTGSRSFATTVHGTIYQSMSATPPPDPIPTTATPVQ